MTRREWIEAIIEGKEGLPIPQHWMSFFNSETAKRLTPDSCHYERMWWYDVVEEYDMSPMGPKQLDRMVRFNEYTGRCFSCLGKGANISFGHGGPGEFFVRLKERTENSIVVEFETGVLAKIQFNPFFYYSYNHPVKSIGDVKNLKLPDPNNPRRYEGIKQDTEYLKAKGEYVLGSLNGFFSGLHYFFIEYQELLISFITDPKLVHELLEVIGNWNLVAAENMIKAEVDCIALCDDLGSKDSLLISPDYYRSFVKPWHKRLCERVHELGGRVHFHTHGANQPILDDLVECGFDFINPFDPEEGWNIEEVLRNYSDKFVVVGGFPTKFWYWGAEEQEKYLIQMGELGRKYPRYIFMDSGGVPEDVTREDFERITEVSRRERGVERVAGCI